MSKVYAGTVDGIEGVVVEVEASKVNGGIAGRLDVVGMVDSGQRELRARVRSALRESMAFNQPATEIKLSPRSDQNPVTGSGFDLAVAVATLELWDESIDSEAVGFLGELGLDGTIRPVRGVLPIVAAMKAAGVAVVVVPRENGPEAATVDGIDVVVADRLNEVAGWLCEVREIYEPGEAAQPWYGPIPDLADVRGNAAAVEAAVIAAAGGHALHLIGAPGSGKTMLARRIPSILPEMTYDEETEVTSVYSVAGLLGHNVDRVRARPFRSPHHTISDVGLVGGGSTSPRPGEASLAHGGVLFLDELPEFRRRALDVLRSPIESGEVAITRRLHTTYYPSSFMLITAANPCACGFFGSARRPCACTPDQRARYAAQVSHPKRGVVATMSDLGYEELQASSRGPSSAEARARVEAARERQEARGALNDTLSLADALGEGVEIEIGGAIRDEDHALRIARIARTIADLDGRDSLTREDLQKAEGLAL